MSNLFILHPAPSSGSEQELIVKIKLCDALLFYKWQIFQTCQL